MTANELRYNVLVGVDSLFGATAPGYNNKQMSAVLNKAQRRVFGDYAKLFDQNEKIKRILAPLTKRASLLEGDVIPTVDTDITNYPHATSDFIGTFYTLPADLGRIVEEALILSIDNVNQEPSIVFPITYDYFLKNYRSRYKKPYVYQVWRMDAKLETVSAVERPVVELIIDRDHDVEDYIVSYIKYPASLVVDTVNPFTNMTSCEIIDESFNEEIVGEAIKIITAALNDEGYQVTGMEKKFDEN